MSERYPLEAVRIVRDAARDEATDALRDAMRELERARERQARAADRLRAFRERSRAAAGDRQCTAAELQLEARHRERLRAEEARLADALALRSAEVGGAEETVRRAREALAARDAEAEVIERHRTGWVEKERREAARKAEDERDDQAAAARGRDEFRRRFREP